MKTRLYGLIPLLLAFSLSACSGGDTTAVGYTAYNYTDKSIVSIIVNGEGGILNVPADSGVEGGGDICCAVIPTKWHPGLTARIKWQLDGHWVRDKNGKIVVKDGHDQFVEGEWKERTVEILQYDEKLGQLQIHFFPHDAVKAVVSNVFPGHPDYPLALPQGN